MALFTQQINTLLALEAWSSTTAPGKLATPANLRQNGTDSNGKAILLWDAVPNATGYRLLQGGSVQIGTGTATTYAVDAGSYQVQALGTGSYSNSDYSAAFQAATGGAAPSGTLARTGSGPVPFGQSVTLSINPTVSAGRTVASVRFEQSNGTEIFTDSASPYSYQWTPNPGAYYVRAKITDSTGAIGYSNTLAITAQSASAFDPATISWTELSRGRAQSFFDPNLPRYVNAVDQATLSAVTIDAISGAAGSVQWDAANNRMQLIKTGPGYVRFTWDALASAPFTAIEAVVNGLTTTGNGGQFYVGMWRPGTGAIHGVGSSFNLFSATPGNDADRNFLFVEGNAYPFQARNGSLARTQREVLRTITTDDYLTAVRGSDSTSNLNSTDPSAYTNTSDCRDVDNLSANGPAADSILTTCKFGLIIASDGDVTLNLESFKAGWFGGVGESDQTFITNEDGTPFIVNNKAYYTATQKGLASTNFDTPDAVCTVVKSLDLTTRQVASVRKLFARYGSRTVGNASTSIVVDRPAGVQRWVSPSWGNVKGQTAPSTSIQGLRIDMFATAQDLTQPGISVLTPTKRWDSLGMAYDAALTYQDGYWYLAYSRSTGVVNGSGYYDFYFYISRTTDLLSDNWQQIATRNDNSYEGSKVVVFDGVPEFVCGQHGAAQFYRYYIDGTYAGPLANPMPQGQTSHPGIIPFIDQSGASKYLLVTMTTGLSSLFLPDRIYTNGETVTWESN